METYLAADWLQSLGLRLDERSQLQALWNNYIAEPLVRHVRPVRYAQGQLSIEANTSAWASRVRHQQSALMQKLRLAPYFKDLTHMTVRVCPSQMIVPTDIPAAVKPTRLSPQTSAILLQAATGITDPDVRGALARLGNGEGGEATKRKI